MIPYSAAYLLAITLTLIGVAIDLTMGANESLELPRRAIAIFGIVNGVIAAATAFLPAVNSQGDSKSEAWALGRKNIVMAKK